MGKKTSASNATPRDHGFFSGGVFLGENKASARNATPRDHGFLQKDAKNGSGKNVFTLLGLLGSQVQNELKTLGNRFLSSDLNFLKNVKNGSGKQMFTLLGHFSGTCAESHENAREVV